MNETRVQERQAVTFLDLRFTYVIPYIIKNMSSHKKWFGMNFKSYDCGNPGARADEWTDRRTYARGRMDGGERTGGRVQ